MNLRLMIFLVPTAEEKAEVFRTLARSANCIPARVEHLEHEDLHAYGPRDGLGIQHRYMTENAGIIMQRWRDMANALGEDGLNYEGHIDVLLVAEESDSGMFWIERGCDIGGGNATLSGGTDISAAIAGWYAQRG